jgi:hypothetical protein
MLRLSIPKETSPHAGDEAFQCPNGASGATTSTSGIDQSGKPMSSSTQE